MSKKEQVLAEQTLPMSVEQFVEPARFQKFSQQVLAAAKKAHCDAAEVVFSAGVGLQVCVRLEDVETIEFNRDKGCGITVYKGKRKGSVSTSELTSEALEKAVKLAAELADLTEPDEWAGLAEKTDLAETFPDLALYHPWGLQTEEAIHLAKETESYARAVDSRIVNSEGASVSSHQSYFVYANSHGFMGGYSTSRHSLNCVVIGQENESMERDDEYTTTRMPEALESARWVGEGAARKTLSRLNARRIPTQTAPVLFKAQVAGGLIDKFIGAVSGGRLYRKTTFLLDSLGKQIFPEWFSLEEDPFILSGNASCPFDNEGVRPLHRKLIEGGVVQGYVLSSYSARRLGLMNTGNAGGAHNLSVKTGFHSLEELIKGMHRGLLVTELMGSGINLVTGDYSRGAAGFWVENGEIQYPVHEITIAGNLSDMFQNILAVGNDVDHRSSILTGSILLKEMTIAGA